MEKWTFSASIGSKRGRIGGDETTCLMEGDGPLEDV